MQRSYRASVDFSVISSCILISAFTAVIFGLVSHLISHHSDLCRNFLFHVTYISLEEACWVCVWFWSETSLSTNLQDTLMEGVKHYFGGGAAAMNLHERIADLLLMQLSFSMEDPGMPLIISA